MRALRGRCRNHAMTNVALVAQVKREIEREKKASAASPGKNCLLILSCLGGKAAQGRLVPMGGGCGAACLLPSLPPTRPRLAHL